MKTSQRFLMNHNVTIRVLDKYTGKVIQEHEGHNTATNTMIEGIGHYLVGAGVLRQGYSMLSDYIPKYISLGTMGLRNQNEDSTGLPTGISGTTYTGDEATDFTSYLNERPGYGADGYSAAYNNGRPYLGLGPAYTSFSVNKSYYKGDITYYNGVAYVAQEDMIVDPDTGVYNYWNPSNNKWAVAPAAKQPTCHELISPEFPRVDISFRDVVPEYESEHMKTIDVVFSAMISTGALAQFRDPGKDYIFITEAGLWSEKEYQDDNSGNNGLVAAYRVAPPSKINWAMKPEDVTREEAIIYLYEQGVEHPTDEQIELAKGYIAVENRNLLKHQVLRVERDQVVQVIWKIEIGNADSIEEIQMSYIPGDIEQRLKALERLIESKAIYAENIYVSPSRWSSSSEMSGYPYRARITMSGVNSTYFSIVQFSDEDVDMYDLCPTSVAGTNMVTIYCKTKPTTTVYIPIIMCSQSTRVSAS